jgi:serine/threonine protein kinase
MRAKRRNSRIEINVIKMSDEAKAQWEADNLNLAPEYKIVKQIGKGSFGQVFVGRHCQLMTYVAIKKGTSESKSEKNRRYGNQFVKKEAELLRKLNSKNVVKCVKFKERAGCNYLVMEYLG